MTTQRPANPRSFSISAITLATRDLNRALEFYRKLGLQLRHIDATTPFATFAAGEEALNLIEQPDHRPTFWGRVILRVADVDALHQHLVDQGIRTDTAPADAVWGERFFHVTDPDGHQLSFAQPIDR